MHIGDDTEIAATTAQGPEQFLLMIVQRSDDAAVGQDNFGAEQIVECQSKPANQWPVPPPRVRPAIPTGLHEPVTAAMPNGSTLPRRPEAQVPPATLAERFSR